MPNFVRPSLPQDHPANVLKALAASEDCDIFSKGFAKLLDERDPLASFRKRFCYPLKITLPKVDKNAVEDLDEECIYMCGNSLGLKPKSTDEYVLGQLQKWAKTGVETHFEEPLPAALCDNYGLESLGRLVGADPEEVTLMNGLTVNLHLLLISFYQPTRQRFKILIEKNAFPSDRYAVRSQAAMRGFNPDEAIIEVDSDDECGYISTDDILKILQIEGESISVVCLSGVQYYTGQKFDMDTITRKAHEKGCIVGWDLAHAIGNVELFMDDWDVDFACWCTYKYLNSGPGCIAGAYVNKKHNKRKVPHLQGWWSNKTCTRFLMQDECDLAEGVDGFRLCNPPPLLVSCVMASLEIFDDAGMDNILKKQFLLTGYLEFLLDELFEIDTTDCPVVKIITPRDNNQRGCQLSLIFSFSLRNVHEQIQKRGVVCDVRQPNVMRIAPAPLYNSFTDVYRFVEILKEVVYNHK